MMFVFLRRYFVYFEQDISQEVLRRNGRHDIRSSIMVELCIGSDR